MTARYYLISLALFVLRASPATAQPAAAEPAAIEIGTTPLLFVDNFIVDNTWAMRQKVQHIDRVFHQPAKHAQNPLLHGDLGYVCTAYDAQTSRYHMWYQTHAWSRDDEGADYAVAYATSQNGIEWERPNLGLHQWKGNKQNNIVITGKRGRASSPWLLDLPEKDKRGYKYVLAYRDRDGTHLIGTNDGVHFDPASDRQIQRLHSDTQNAIVYDPLRDQYVMYCRAKAVYRAFGSEMIDTGESRRVARIANQQLWSDWPSAAANVLLPDELDTKNRYHAFYGMPTTVYGNVFFGFVWPFRWNDRIHTELAWSRDGEHFDRHPLRPKLIDYGPPGSWDDEMVFASSWVETGDEWRIYYAGWDGPHNTRDRTGGLGLATLRREGFVSLRGPDGGGVVCTKPLRWPGGQLLVNCDAAKGKLTVRLSDSNRKPLPGFDHTDCLPLQTNQTRAPITWQSASIADLTGKTIRLELYIETADLYSFCASGG